MKIGRAVTLAVCILMFLAPLAAYETGGESVPTTECNDDVDNDRDTETDENDPGCLKPYYEDDSENDVYDLDAAAVFSDVDGGDSQSTLVDKFLEGPSAYFGWKVTRTRFSDDNYPDEVVNGGDDLNTTWVGWAEENYRGGTVNWTLIELTSNLDYYTQRNPDFAGLVDSPAPDTSQTCGDGQVQSGENTLNCPEDAGMPQQKDNEIEGTITGDLESYSAGGASDNVRYIMDLELKEWTSGSSAWTEDITGLCTTSDSCDDTSKTFPLEVKKDHPDFFLKDGKTEIWAVYPVKDGDGKEKIRAFDDYGLKEKYLYDSYTTETTSSCSGMNCTLDSSPKECTDSPDSYTGYELQEKDPKKIKDSYRITTDTNDNLGYDKVEETQNADVEITLDAKGGENGETYYGCPSSDSEVEHYSCETKTNDYYSCDSSGTAKGGDTYYSFSGGGDKPIGYKGPATKTYYYEDYKLEERKVFDLDPSVNPSSVEAKEALFNNEYDMADVIQRSFNSEGWFSYVVPDDGRDQGNDYAVSLTRFSITTEMNNFISKREEYHSYDADGPRGLGDGFVAIDEGSIKGVTPMFLDREYTDGASGSFVSASDVSSQLDLSCPGDSIKCVASIDVNLTNLDGWTSTQPSSGISFHMTSDGPHNVKESFGVCKLYQRLYKRGQGEKDSELKCQPEYDLSGGGGGGGGGDDGEPGICGDEAGEYHVLMEGPEVDEDVMENYPNDYRACLDTNQAGVTRSSCNLNGDIVSEGYVGNVAPNPAYSDAKYEEGGNSPDWEVCLDLEGTGIGDEGDERAGDNRDDDSGKVDYGGEWYDLDSEMAQQYLRGVEDGTYDTRSGDDLVSDGDPGDPHDIAYYWNSQVNAPQDDQYNPQGGRAGTALEDDCGNTRFDSLRCDDQGATNDRGHGSTSTFFSFFEEGLRDEDFEPQGGSTNDGNNLAGFTGVVNRLQERSDQLEPGMDTDVYGTADYNRWEDTRGGSYADSWAVSKYENWSVDSTGTPYPPYSAWYRDPGDIRTQPSSPSREKMEKAFGNSFAAIAEESFTYDNEEGTTVQVEPGDGVWIDPDAMKNIGSRYSLDPDGDGWRSALAREDRTGYSVGMKIDLTGEDAGIGVDVNSNGECLVSRDDGGCKVMAKEIDWERDDSGNIVSQLERPMCGDDRHEYLIEQGGESPDSEQYAGPYACADSLNSCYHSDAPEGERVVDQGVYRDVDEPGEKEGRLKDDREVCQKVDGQDDYALWYDQDYRESFCRQNTIYGPEGVRWFDAQYVADHPQAVSGGIDDSWNDYLAQIGHRDYDSDPTATESEVTTGGEITPVPTGDNNDVTATLGFCGGDDESEYLVTQECNTRYCETDRAVQGVAKVPGSCVLRADNSLYETDVSERQIFKPGDQVEITGVRGNPTIACFNGAWFSEWPISFNQDAVDVPLGGTRTVSFDVVNIRNSETTFRVTMEESSDDPGADQFASFVQHSGDTFTTTVEPTSSKTFQVEITGGNDNVDESDLNVRAEGINAGLRGHDSVEVSIEPQEEVDIGRSSETEDVPGIRALQLLALTLISTLVFFTRGN